MTKHIALLDVDDTLIHRDAETGKYEINWPLIQALKGNGITDIILFTNMSLNDISKKNTNGKNHISRVDLINQLTQQGFSVHDVVTPADRFYKDGKPGAFFNEVYLPQYKKNISSANQEQQLSSDFIQDREFGFILNGITTAVSTTALLQDAKYRIVDQQNGKMVDKSMTAAGRGYQSPKGLMADGLLPQLIERFGTDIAIFYGDDRQQCLDDLMEAAKRFTHATGIAIPVKPCLVSKRLQQAHHAGYHRPIAELIQQTEQQALLRAALAAVPEFIQRSKYNLRNLQDIAKYRNYFTNNEQAQTFLNHFLLEADLSQRISQGNVATWLSLANMAAQGSGLYQNKANLYDAYNLLVLAVLYAENDDVYNHALEQLNTFLTQAKLHEVLRKDPSDVVVAQLDETQYRNGDQLTQASAKTAHKLVSHLKNHALWAGNISWLDQRLRQRFIAVYQARLTALSSYEASSINEQTKITDEVKRSAATFKEFTLLHDDIAANETLRNADLLSLEQVAQASSSTANPQTSSSSCVIAAASSSESSSSTSPAKASQAGMFASLGASKTQQMEATSLTPGNG